MRSYSLKEFEFGLAELEKYIDYNSACNRVISDSEMVENLIPESTAELLKISTNFRRKKVFEYNSYIISLYGLFERFLENVLEDYLTDICFILKDFNKLPPELRKNLLNTNIDILRNLNNPKFQNVSVSDFIHNIYKAISENKAILNIEAFQHHPYNFKQSIVSEYFGNIGISGLSGTLKIYEPLKGLLNNKYGNPANIDSDVLYQFIDDLSLRRNDVAHGVENVELLNVSIIREYIEFLRSYCRSLFNILQNESMSFLYNESDKNFKLITVINNSIICGSVKSISFSKSDYILVKKPETNYPRYEMFNIEDIQIDNVSHESLTVIDTTNVGIRLNGYVKENNTFKIVTAPNTI